MCHGRDGELLIRIFLEDIEDIDFDLLFSVQNATWAATPEVLPTHLRATGHAFCNFVARIGGFFTPFLVENRNYSLAQIGIVLGTLNLVAAAFAGCLPETMGRSLDAAAAQATQTTDPSTVAKQQAKNGTRSPMWGLVKSRLLQRGGYDNLSTSATDDNTDSKLSL